MRDVFDKKHLLDYYNNYLDRPHRDAIRKYYDGFKLNVIRRNPMFEEELNELDKVYEAALKNTHKQMEGCLPQLLYYMEEFVTLHKHNEALREKLDALRAKTGKPQQDGESDE